MSNGSTLKERMAVLETKMDNHIHHHETRDKWMMGVLSGLVIGIVLLIIRLFTGWVPS